MKEWGDKTFACFTLSKFSLFSNRPRTFLETVLRNVKRENSPWCCQVIFCQFPKIWMLLPKHPFFHKDDWFHRMKKRKETLCCLLTLYSVSINVNIFALHLKLLRWREEYWEPVLCPHSSVASDGIQLWLLSFWKTWALFCFREIKLHMKRFEAKCCIKDA